MPFVINFEDQKPIDVEKTCEHAYSSSSPTREPSPHPSPKLHSERCHLHCIYRCCSETINRLMHFFPPLQGRRREKQSSLVISNLGKQDVAFGNMKGKKEFGETVCSAVVLIFRQAMQALTLLVSASTVVTDLFTFLCIASTDSIYHYIKVNPQN